MASDSRAARAEGIARVLPSRRSATIDFIQNGGAMPDDKITVTFIDETTAETIGTVDLPVTNLPDTFELETTS